MTEKKKATAEFTQEDLDLIKRYRDELMPLARERCASEEEFEVVVNAFAFADEAHMNVRRRSGEPYIIHPIEVAKIVVQDIGLGYKSISAALLHDVVEDTDYTVADIRLYFGDKIASLVDGLTKIKSVLDNEDRNSYRIESNQAVNFRRILLTMNDDVRVVLIKLADRLHNCRTIQFMPEFKRDKILAETMHIFIPLAHRLGLFSVKSEMENIWLKYTEPDAYNSISARINENVAERDRQVDEFIAPISTALEKHGFKFRIIKRIKSPYSVWRKMERKHIPFEQIYDLYAVRIIYDPGDEKDIERERQQAFLIYSIIMTLYSSNPGRYRNWISSQKSNGYEALHCTLMSHAGFWVEVQIRSKRMDDIAERGIAAHWAYKQEGYVSENDSAMDQWLAKIQDILQSNNLNDLGLLDLIHTDFTSSEIYVFTPKGDQKTIAAGATALDFAYLIHTHIGNSAAAAKVNMKLVPLSHVLRPGDQVEILTHKSATPQKEWLKFLKTRHARALVIEYFRAFRAEIEKEGKHIYESRLAVGGIKDTNDIRKQFFEIVQMNDIHELYFKVGLGIIDENLFDQIIKGATPSRQVSYDGHKYVLATCCHPIPGDPVMGLMDDEGNIHVHKKSCPVLEGFATKHGDRLVPAKWPDLEHDFLATIHINGIDRVGLLNEITHYVSLNMGVNMRSLNLGSQDGIFDGKIDMLVRDRKVLDKILDGLSKIDGIQTVERTFQS